MNTIKKNNEVVIVTGGGSGIGRSTVILLARRNYKIVVVGRSLSKLHQVASEVEKEGTELMIIDKDITKSSSAKEIVRKTLDRFSRVDVLINNAGVPGEGVLLHEMDDDLWSEIIETNLTAQFKLIHAVLPVFIAQNSGNIINVASIAANIAMPNMAAYASAKAGLIALTRNIAFDYANLGIRCNSVCPGAMLTDMTKSTLNKLIQLDDTKYSMKIGKPVDVAHVIAFLCSTDSLHINGSSVVVDGGQGRV